jgi:purine-binding chemotaxis protein CheW
MDTTQDFLVFHSSGLDCAFPLEAVREIVPMARLSSPPGLPSGLAGLLNLRGTAIPIIRMDRLFDLPEQQPGLHTPMIVLRGIRGPIGILVHAVGGIAKVPLTKLLEIPADSTFHGCATGGIELEGVLIHLLSPATLLQANEDRLLADYSAMSEARILHMRERT